MAYLAATAQGDLGFSFVYRGLPVVDVLADRIWPTVILFGLGEIIAIVLGVGLGAYTGWRRGGLVDHLGNGASLVLYATPYFLIGMTLLLVFAVGLGWFPTYGMYDVGATYNGFTDQLTDFLSHLALPLATVALGLIGQYAIVMRSSIVETLGEEYITTARAKGIPDRNILRRHAMPNAMLPMATLIAINLGYVVAGAITVEVVFNWPGLGTLTVDALAARDYPVLQGIFLILSVSVVAGQPRRRSRLSVPRPAGQGMTSPAVTPDVVIAHPRRRRLTRSRDVLRQIVRRRSGLLGIGILVFFTVLALFPTLLVGPLQTATTATGPRLAPPQPGYPLGTDELGRSIANLTVHGARISMVIGLLATLVTVLLGVLIGIVAGFIGGRTDSFLMRITDFFLVIPTFVLAIILAPVIAHCSGPKGRSSASGSRCSSSSS